MCKCNETESLKTISEPQKPADDKLINCRTAMGLLGVTTYNTMRKYIRKGLVTAYGEGTNIYFSGNVVNEFKKNTKISF